MNELFLDASYVIALSSITDSHHSRAQDLARQVERNRTLLITTRAVVWEVGNALSRRRFRSAAVALLDSMARDPRIEILPATEELCQKAFDLFKGRPDKEWGLTDCLSFVVMEERKLMGALTADDHFRQAGFRALLLEVD